jgi:hypothetical protein
MSEIDKKIAQEQAAIQNHDAITFKKILGLARLVQQKIDSNPMDNDVEDTVEYLGSIKESLKIDYNYEF